MFNNFYSFHTINFSSKRKYVIFRMKNLRFLDCYEVTKTERELSTKDSLFYDVVKLEQADDQKRSSQNEDNTKGYTPLSKKNEPSVPEVAPQSWLLSKFYKLLIEN